MTTVTIQGVTADVTSFPSTEAAVGYEVCGPCEVRADLGMRYAYRIAVAGYTALRLRVRKLIEEGRLPVMLPKAIFASYGEGNLCHACDQPITPAQIEYGVDHDINGSPFSLRLHPRLPCEPAIRTSQTVFGDTTTAASVLPASKARQCLPSGGQWRTLAAVLICLPKTRSPGRGPDPSRDRRRLRDGRRDDQESRLPRSRASGGMSPRPHRF